jgi:hypothetical protein
VIHEKCKWVLPSVEMTVNYGNANVDHRDSGIAGLDGGVHVLVCVQGEGDVYGGVWGGCGFRGCGWGFE